MWQLGGVPQLHRIDNLSAAVQTIEADRTRRWTERYLAVMTHYGLTPSPNTPGQAHENGDVEQSHYRFKQAVDQALRIRGSRDFVDCQGRLTFGSCGLLVILQERRYTTCFRTSVLEAYGIH